jgi:hypothetical protein
MEAALKNTVCTQSRFPSLTACVSIAIGAGAMDETYAHLRKARGNEKQFHGAR